MVEALERFLSAHEDGAYDRDNFDKYCAKRKLSLSCPVIHVTGSNGKGSTVRFLENIYRAAGYRVATFTKPAFYEVNETIRFQGEPIDDVSLSKLYEEYKKDFEKFGLTAFEATVALAYRYFNEKKPDIALIEAGMGGAIDATNLDDLQTRLAIITSVSLEHTAYLGTTASQIALHKAGIIKEESLVLIGKLDEICLDTIKEVCREMNAPLLRVQEFHADRLADGVYHFDYSTYKDLQIPTYASYQIKNACLAVSAVTALAEEFPVDEESLRKGLMGETLPCRAENLGRIVLDGAHNPEAIENLCRCLFNASKGRRIHVLFASFRDKNIAIELPCLANNVTDITLTTFNHPRARGEFDYFLYSEDHPFVADPVKALEDLLERFPEDVVLVTGSLNFAGYMRKEILDRGLEMR